LPNKNGVVVYTFLYKKDVERQEKIWILHHYPYHILTTYSTYIIDRIYGLYYKPNHITDKTLFSTLTLQKNYKHFAQKQRIKTHYQRKKTHTFTYSIGVLHL